MQSVDHSVLGPVIQTRDELFVGREPILLMVEPQSLVITRLYAIADRDAETRGCVLLLTQDRRAEIRGLAEDGCIPYGASYKAAKLDVAIQKDVWHPLEEVRKVIKEVEREAYQKLKAAERLQKQLGKHWDEVVLRNGSNSKSNLKRWYSKSTHCLPGVGACGRPSSWLTGAMLKSATEPSTSGWPKKPSRGSSNCPIHASKSWLNVWKSNYQKC